MSDYAYRFVERPGLPARTLAEYAAMQAKRPPRYCRHCGRELRRYLSDREYDEQTGAVVWRNWLYWCPALLTPWLAWLLNWLGPTEHTLSPYAEAEA